jgi:hypothetical protein
MPTIADYAVFGESTVSLEFNTNNTEVSYDFPLPSDLSEFSSGILTFLVDTDGANGLNWEVEVNGNRAKELTHPSDRFCAFQVIVPEAHFQLGANTVTVRVLGGIGKLKVSEFAFHYQRNI